MIRLGFPIFRKVQDNYRFGGFETHRSSFKSKEMNPATLAPRILWLSTKLRRLTLACENEEHKQVHGEATKLRNEFDQLTIGVLQTNERRLF